MDGMNRMLESLRIPRSPDSYPIHPVYPGPMGYSLCAPPAVPSSIAHRAKENPLTAVEPLPEATPTP